MKNSLLLFVALLSLGLGAVVYHFYHKPEMPEYALYYSQPRAIKPFQLTDQQGQPFTKQNLLHQWSWLFFGYTSCPDVCPTTLQELNYRYPALKKIANNTQVIFVSVDPKRDSQTKLKKYIHYFNSAFIALRGEHTELYPFARNLGLMYAIVEPKDKATGDNYLVEHSASIVLVNPQGNISAIFRPKQAVGEVPSVDGVKMVSDFAKIVALYSAQ